ncbi:hypothetical protein A2630_03720 [Candidatus Woesebacteria bacterium RIFCSPHIGHO2_01_FULL_44_10]|uniref:Undecaprenyl-diphosphatase n=1 Tax=Candidatus Woesebacteria bacterium RIFCSPLOWO2_01_FULL_44_14 TaxID=1802525 RepID=A0A1F8C3R5_9BACT|nr:MAG: hypothetical protein A2630_03720 [Candidatus Woesebacteria bacterium RIFCSPHIGHO2_01_FULL_44_10]OGM54897.1 MAG: hypothetical protein A3F62_04395 [Candidatus Woesebacteria bacterium RIFCSPHIGHO2_12_FULL_44_11]OGM70308.1 MAG: hypothetical protein A2975_04540 [Candidatus Woesebacteria bacterium RIFCSPLOWO2_01_FULL_44_14]
MSLISALVLGIIQGLTEFLPVSSSGHLVLAQNLLPGFDQPGVLFDVILHAGTLLAIVIYFWKTLLGLSKNYLVLLAVGSIPAAVVGYLFSNFVEGLFGSVKVVGVALLVTAAMNFITDMVKEREGKKVKVWDALVVGFAQAIAIIPGLSRSGSTIFAATSRGIERQKAAEFSFLLSVPAVLGANLLQFSKYGGDSFGWSLYAVGFLAALVFGLLSIKLTLSFLQAKNFKIFGAYCLMVGLVAIFLG